MNSKSLEYKDVLYVDLMDCILASVVMEWKQTVLGSYVWKADAFWWMTDVKQTFHYDKF